MSDGHARLFRLGCAVGVGLLAVVIGLLPRLTARATDGAGTSVPTSAVVDPTGMKPNIECKWELPDMDSSVAGIQYSRPAHTHDDDMSLAPGRPCDLQRDASGAPAGKPTMADGVHHMIQVKPNLEDQPEQRRIQLWMAVDHPAGLGAITDVFWDVYHPDGSKKVQAHGTRVLPGSSECQAWGSGGGPDGSMFEAAVHTGQLTAAAVDDENFGMVAKCFQEEKAFYYGEFSLSKDQMCGEYKIVATAVGVGGTTTSLMNYIDVLCVFALDIDFNRVDWGLIYPGVSDVVSGDLIWNVPPDNAPTVRNIGNDGMGVKVHFSTMTGAQWAKTIDRFDAKFGRSAATLVTRDPIPANQWVDFGSGAAQVLCANELGKLDLSIHPPGTLPGDTYTGSFDIAGFSVPGECKGSAHVSG